jgi:hypothetical protein
MWRFLADERHPPKRIVLLEFAPKGFWYLEWHRSPTKNRKIIKDQKDLRDCKDHKDKKATISALFFVLAVP